METCQPAIARPAATVILVRPAGKQFQIYLLQRNAKSSFMGGLYVFPGGVLDPEDRDLFTWRRRVDSGAAEVLRRLGGGIAYEEVLAYGVAAVRETFEEAGVLLARPEKDPAESDARDRACDRFNGGFREKIVSEKRLLAFRRLHRWAHWVTPQRMKRRYDTRFFLSVLPPGQQCRPDRREMVRGVWLGPREGLAANMEGRIPLSPPTLISLQELAGFRKMAELENALASRGWGAALHPRLVPLNKGALIIEPWDPAYRREIAPPDERALEAALLPPGAPFSRMWLRKGIWRPIAGA